MSMIPLGAFPVLARPISRLSEQWRIIVLRSEIYLCIHSIEIST